MERARDATLRPCRRRRFLSRHRPLPPPTTKPQRFSRGARRIAGLSDRLEQGAKVLRGWVSKNDAVQILDWAARHRFGHRGFLELGGADFVGRGASRNAEPDRVRRTARSRAGARGGGRFPQDRVAVATEALLQGSSMRLARDRIEADLVRHLQRVERRCWRW